MLVLPIRTQPRGTHRLHGCRSGQWEHRYSTAHVSMCMELDPITHLIRRIAAQRSDLDSSLPVESAVAVLGDKVIDQIGVSRLGRGDVVRFGKKSKAYTTLKN